ncbi:hypothetical protein [Chryseobacterium sp.]|uniref:hypothetical protein n=1 Tax=Chryseobacterium sp. TaxID=1871047 RepID=UPI00289E64BD|nr:hypothetical protein [Chryseobacterium sp.]
MNAVVLKNQSLLDIAIQTTGTVDNCFAIAVANGFSVSDFLLQDKALFVSDELANNTDVLYNYSLRQIKPATGLTEKEIDDIPTLKGIGYMIVGGTFKVDKNE